MNGNRRYFYERTRNLKRYKRLRWTVLKYVGKLPIGSKGIHRETLLCRCKCGYTQNITSIRLLNKQVTCCRKCSKNKNKDIV